MRKIALAGMSTLSGLVMLFSYHTSLNQSAEAATAAPATGSTSSGSSTSSSSGSSSDDSSDWAADDSSGVSTPSATQGSSSSSSSGSSTKSSSGSSSSGSGTYTGDAVQTRWGLVQVEITVQNGKITKAEAVQYPQENHKDVEINSFAVPTLNAAVVQAQSANIDSISGATVTSQGYIASLQSALDQANL